jgi:hypothetical protein
VSEVAKHEYNGEGRMEEEDGFLLGLSSLIEKYPLLFEELAAFACL